MPDPVDISDHRPHGAGYVVCLRCLAFHVAVWPLTREPVLLECPECHEMACMPWAGPILDGFEE